MRTFFMPHMVAQFRKSSHLSGGVNPFPVGFSGKNVLHFTLHENQGAPLHPLFSAPGREPALAAQAGGEDPVVYADQKTIGEDALRAAGHVEVLWQDYVITADAIDFNLKSRELFAEGRVTLAAKDMVLSGEKLVFNLKTQNGRAARRLRPGQPLRPLTGPTASKQTDRDTLRSSRASISPPAPRSRRAGASPAARGSSRRRSTSR